jgi:protein arginine kinase activator
MKTCQVCERRPAVVEFIQVTGDERREMALCRECALSIGVRAQVEAFQRLSQLLTEQESSGPFDADALQSKCTRCGMLFQEFVRTGLLGCPHCYQDFRELLKPALRRLHGVIRQMPDAAEPVPQTPAPKAKATKSAESREQLEVELNLALIDEDYERAAALRDKLRDL